MRYALLLCALFLSLIITFDLFLKEPPVWPDEGGLANFAIQVNKNPLNYYSYYPSIYIIVLAKWFNIFGVSIVNQRGLSLIGGILCIFISFLILKQLQLKKQIFLFIALILLITDFTFLQATRVGRPEIWTIFFGLLSIYFLYKYINSEYKKYWFYLISFITAIISGLFHFNGFIFLGVLVSVTLINFKNMIIKNTKQLIFTSLLYFPLILLLIFRFSYFISFIPLRLKISFAQETWLTTVFTSKPLELKLVYLSLILISLMFLFYFLKNYKKKLVLATSLIFSWLVLIINKDFWYAVFLVIFVIFTLAFLMDRSFDNWQTNKISNSFLIFFVTIFLATTLFISNTKFHFEILNNEGGDKYSYEKFIEKIQENIPDNKTVFSSSIPDTYYAFVQRKNNKFARYPQGFVSVDYYLEIFNNTDYIIFNGIYGDNYYGDIVLRYIEKNKLNVYQIGEPDQYQAYIIELKSKEQRVNP